MYWSTSRALTSWSLHWPCPWPGNLGVMKKETVLQSCYIQRLVGGFFPPSTVQVTATQTWERVQLNSPKIAPPLQKKKKKCNMNCTEGRRERRSGSILGMVRALECTEACDAEQTKDVATDNDNVRPTQGWSVFISLLRSMEFCTGTGTETPQATTGASVNWL